MSAGPARFVAASPAGTALAGVPGDAADGADPISAALTGAVEASGPPGRVVLERAARIASEPTEDGVALEAMLSLVRLFPSCERFQVLAARLLERRIGRAAAIPVWSAVAERFPSSHEAFLLTLRWAFRHCGAEVALDIIGRRFGIGTPVEADLLLRARAWDEVGDVARAEADFRAHAHHDSTHATGRLLHARALERRGDLCGARDVLATARGVDARLSAERARLEADLRRLNDVPPAADGGPNDIGSRVLAHLLDRATYRRGTPHTPGGVLGPVLMVNASLGAGGAERQLVNTALGLQGMRLRGHPVAGCRLEGEVAVMCRALDDRPGGDFFLPALRGSGIVVDCYAALPPLGGDAATSAAREWRDLLHLLPPRAAEGTARLADRLRALAPSVVHLWQDGTILACGLAALLAGVPRIVLSVRSAPPPDRPERDRPEYAVLYPALMRAPGVVMTANSRFAAARYAEWIGLPPDAVQVIPNGLAKPGSEGTQGSRLLLEAFDTRAGRGFTVGGVMRFDDNKRPLAWIDCAARVLALQPDARFILVGDGPLRGAAEVRARALGIGERLLFTGRRADVGFWLGTLDAFLLLSRWEGLPNVLIEAQSAGVPVVTTPAGGAAETVLHGKTGWVLSSAELPDLSEAASRLVSLGGGRAYRTELSERARRFVDDHFSLAGMVERTVASYVG